MYRRPRSLRWRVGLGAALAASAAMIAPAAAQAAPIGHPGGLAGGTARPDSVRPFTVTLVTGDKVTVRPAGRDRYAVNVRKAAGRERIPFVSHRTKTGLMVVPADAASLLVNDRLDPRLFDVLLLKRLGYDDSRRSDLPLMSAAPRTKRIAPAAPAGARAVRTLPRLGVTVLRAAKRDTPRLWASFRSGKGGAATSKLWLVGKLATNLDRSVPQVGAPTAWKAGYTGKGVKVALLDTGYDQHHPDLKGVVTAAEDFIGTSDGIQDVVGHGTHVASIIAGRGTASKGRYTGVAKGAELAVGKVCDWEGCPEDAILAGMEWAATQSGAKVVNMSLGGPVSEGGDLLEDAVEQYTAATGTLFVISAGNDGPQPESLGSPGTADSALTVGSVTKQDQLSDFSSRGPRVSPSRRFDYAVKPEITAPGQDIVAARATGTLGDVAVGKDYARLSGTSMAAPHVAGAAAILAGQHPDWSPAQLKAVLASTAKPNPKLSVYEQGAGRLDVGRAVTQQVQASTGVLSLGYFPWPNADAPTVRKTVRYTNTGKTAVTLKVALAVKDAQGRPAKSGMFTASAPTITVPAGGSAPVTVTVKPTAGVVGLYSGALTATAADGRTVVRTAIGAYKEPESYNLSLGAMDRDGRRAFADLMIVNQKTGATYFNIFGGWSDLIRLPAGNYTVVAATYDFPADPEAPVSTTMGARSIRLGKVTEVLFDARKGKPLSVGVDRKDASPQTLGLSLSQNAGERGGGLGVGATPGHAYVIPGTETAPGLEFGVSTTLTKAGTGQPGQPATPYTYNVTFPVPGRIPANPQFRFNTAALAKVTQDVHRQGPKEVRELASSGMTPAFPLGFYASTPLGPQRQRTDFFTTHRGVTFGTFLDSGRPGTDGLNEIEASVGHPLISYPAARASVAKWNTAVFGPSFADFADGWSAARLGGLFIAQLLMLGDSQPGHIGVGFTDEGSTTLRRNGVVVATSESPGFIQAELPAANATYRLETSMRRAVTWSQFSNRIEAAWTFRSGHVAGEIPRAVPLLAVRYRPPVDADNRVPASGSVTFPVEVDRNPGTPNAAVTAIAVQVSFDDGKTWQAVKLTGAGDRRTATVQHPGKPGFVSLRATASDAAGNKVEQTIYNAYALK